MLLKTNHLAKPLSLLFHSQLRPFTTLPQSTQNSSTTTTRDPQTTHSFCSNSLKFAAKTGSLLDGKQVHSLILKLGLHNVLALHNQMLHVYVKCKEYDYAHMLFDEMRVRNVVTWNTVICGVVDRRGGDYRWTPRMGFFNFRRMLAENVRPDGITLNALLRGCTELGDVEFGRQVHCFIVKMGFGFDLFVNGALIDFYGKCGFIEEVRRVFDGARCRDLVMWNVMLSCYALNCFSWEALQLFELMRRECFKGDEFTFSSMLSACANMRSCQLGVQLHNLIIKMSFDLDVLVASGLVDMYAKCDNVDDARRIFDMMEVRNIVSWNAMVVGYGHVGDANEALNLFHEMLREGLAADELTLASILSSCGKASAGCRTMQVHAYVVKNGFESFLSVANSLLNAYSKCGTLTTALQCFKSAPNPDLITWTSLIGAYAFHGLGNESIEVFENMVSYGVQPDRIAFLGVLSACSHAGLVTTGLHYFHLMIESYRITPDSEHYTCLIDLLGRAGFLDEVFNVLTSMPIKHGSDALGAFIGACKLHGDAKSAKWAAEKLLELETHNPVNYTLACSLHALQGQWDDMERLREQMTDRCIKKTPGCSRIEILDAEYASLACCTHCLQT